MREIPVPIHTDDFKESFRVYPWRHYVKPFQMIGNTYYIGDDFAGAILIDTGEGLLLIDTGMPTCAPFLIQNIWQLGFRPEDVRKIIHTHHHFDHTGATMVLKKLSGAEIYLSEADTTTFIEHPGLATVGHTEMGWPLTIVDHEILDGDVITLGNTSIKCLLTPGHTDGTVSLVWNITEGSRQYKAALFGGAGFNTLSAEFLMEHYGNLDNQEKFLHSIDRLLQLDDIEVMMANHPMMNHTFEKQKRKAVSGGQNPFYDPKEWKSYLKKLRAEFEDFRK